MVGSKYHPGIFGKTFFFQDFEDFSHTTIHSVYQTMKLGDIQAHLRSIRKIWGDKYLLGVIRRISFLVERAVGFNVTGHSEEGALIFCSATFEKLQKWRRDNSTFESGGTLLPMEEFISQFVNVRFSRFMLQAKKMGLIPLCLEKVGHSHFALIQVKAAMREPNQTISMWVSAGHYATAAWAASRGGAEMILKAHSLFGQPIQIVGPERRVAVGAQLLAQVMAYNNQNVR